MNFLSNLNYDGNIVNEKAPGQAYHGKFQMSVQHANIAQA